MKLSHFAFALLATAGVSTAATLSGTAATRAGTSTGSNIVADRLYVVVIDTNNTGFAAFTTPSGVIPGSSLALGASFGDVGDVVVNRLLSTGTLGSFGSILPGITLTAPQLNKPFGIFWFPTLAATTPGDVTTAPVTIAAGTTYGFVTDSTWVTPSLDSSTKSFGTPDGDTVMNFVNMDQANAAFDPPTGTASYTFIDSDPGDPNTGIKGAATLSVVPEPSTAVLGLLAGLGLIVRRRRA
jgi:hypothetical protein